MQGITNIEKQRRNMRGIKDDTHGRHVHFDLELNDVHLSNLRANAVHVSRIKDLEMKRKRSDSEIVGALTTERPNGVSSSGDPGENISGWRCIELLVDSGAVYNVADPNGVPRVPHRA